MRRSSRCSTALGQSTESRASMMNVSICHQGRETGWFSAPSSADSLGCAHTLLSSSALVQEAVLTAANTALAGRGPELQLAQVCTVLQVFAKGRQPWGHCTTWPGAVGIHSPTAAQAQQRKCHQSGHSTYPNVIVVFQAILHVVQVVIDVQPVQAALQQGVHALESSFPHIKAIVHCVLEWPHLYLNQDKQSCHQRADRDSPPGLHRLL